MMEMSPVVADPLMMMMATPPSSPVADVGESHGFLDGLLAALEAAAAAPPATALGAPIATVAAAAEPAAADVPAVADAPAVAEPSTVVTTTVMEVPETREERETADAPEGSEMVVARVAPELLAGLVVPEVRQVLTPQADVPRPIGHDPQARSRAATIEPQRPVAAGAAVVNHRVEAVGERPRVDRPAPPAVAPAPGQPSAPPEGAVVFRHDASSPRLALASRQSPLPSLGMIGVDRVRFAREQAPSRIVQRLAIDLDGAQVALRFRGDRVAVDVVDDPTGTLGGGWARQVERTLDQAVRTVSDPQRSPQPDQRNDHRSQPDSSGRGGRGSYDDGREPRRQRRWEGALAHLATPANGQDD